jgi:hypothetical protein
MKQLLLKIVSLILPKKNGPDKLDDFIFEHLDGAEFGVILPQLQPRPSVD